MRAKIADNLITVGIYAGVALFGCILTNSIPIFLAFYNGGLALVYLWVYTAKTHDKHN